MRPLLIVLALAAAGAAHAQSTAYLGDARVPDMIKVAPPAPEAGSPEDLADQLVFKHTRALKGSPRWLLARNDNELTPQALWADFACSAGVDFNDPRAQKLKMVVGRVMLDLRPAVDPPKYKYDRKRPFQTIGGEVCIDDVKPLEKNPDYPSGHAALGWVMAEVIAQAAPSRATAILARGRAFAESRAVCGVHNLSSTRAGMTIGSALFAALTADAAFQADIAAARADLAPLVAAAPAVPSEKCAAEAAIVEEPFE
jgi:acid phosphatase (class A)